eukprot:2874867-Alexandrium_andersonii.AAC.1
MTGSKPTAHRNGFVAPHADARGQPATTRSAVRSGELGPARGDEGAHQPAPALRDLPPLHVLLQPGGRRPLECLALVDQQSNPALRPVTRGILPSGFKRAQQPGAR